MSETFEPMGDTTPQRIVRGTFDTITRELVVIEATGREMISTVLGRDVSLVDALTGMGLTLAAPSWEGTGRALWAPLLASEPTHHAAIDDDTERGEE